MSEPIEQEAVDSSPLAEAYYAFATGDYRTANYWLLFAIAEALDGIEAGIESIARKAES